MKNLLKHESFKFFRSGGFITLTVITVIWFFLGAFLNMFIQSQISIDEEVSALIPFMYGKDTLSAIITSIGDFAMVIGIITAMIVVNDFKSETIKHTAMYSVSRQSLFISKFIIQLIAVTLFFVLYSIIYLAVYTAYTGWGEAFTMSSLWNNVIKLFLFGLLISYAITSFMNFFAYFTKSSVLVIVSVFLLGLVSELLTVFYYANPNSFTEFLSNISLSNCILNLCSTPNAQYIFAYIALFSLLFFPAIISSMIRFQKEEIK